MDDTKSKSKAKRKLGLSKETLARASGGPGHRTTNRCTANAWQSCESLCFSACWTECWTQCAEQCYGSTTC